MTEGAWARACAAGGAVAVVLLLAGNEVTKIGGGSPPLHASPREYAEAVGTPAGSLVGGFLVVLGLCLLVPFFASLADTLRRASGDREPLPTVLLGAGSSPWRWAWPRAHRCSRPACSPTTASSTPRSQRRFSS